MELQNVRDPEVDPAPTWDTEPSSAVSLPPADKGKQAYLFLASCVMLDALCWGFPAIFGIFQDYYASHEPFAGSEDIPIIGTCALGIMYLGLPFVFAILKRWPKLRRWSSPAGLVLMCMSLGLSSFSRTVNHLIITQGVLYSIGACFAWTTILFWISEWFVRRLALAYGIMMVSCPFEYTKIKPDLLTGRVKPRRSRPTTDSAMALDDLRPPNHSPRLCPHHLPVTRSFPFLLQASSS